MTIESSPAVEIDPILLPALSAATDKIIPAFITMQSKVEHAAKGAFNPHFKTKYADLPTIIDAYRPLFKDHGLALIQREIPATGGVRLQTIIVHESGQWIADAAPFRPAVKNDPQAYGSALTYLRRQAAASLIGIAQDDDDGAAASRPAKARTSNSKPVAVVSKERRDSLQEEIEKLGDPYPAQIADRLRGEGIAWTTLTTKQLKTVQGWIVECKDLAEANE